MNRFACASALLASAACAGSAGATIVLFETGDGNSNANLLGLGPVTGDNTTYYPATATNSGNWNVFQPGDFPLVLSDDTQGTGLTMDLSAGSGGGTPTRHFHNETGLGSTLGGNNAWNFGDTLLLTFNQPVIIRRAWVNANGNGRPTSITPYVGGVSIGAQTAITDSGRSSLPAASMMTWTSSLSSTTIELRHEDAGNNQNVGIAAIEFEVVPEPTSLALLGLGGLLVSRRRR